MQFSAMAVTKGSIIIMFKFHMETCIFLIPLSNFSNVDRQNWKIFIFMPRKYNNVAFVDYFVQLYPFYIFTFCYLVSPLNILHHCWWVVYCTWSLLSYNQEMLLLIWQIVIKSFNECFLMTSCTDYIFIDAKALFVELK